MKNETTNSILNATKAKDHVMLTGTVLIPGEPDCDATNGEEILSPEKVARIAHEFMNYRIVDKEHEFLITKKNMGEVVESYLLDAPKVMKNIKGEEREYPAGTWVVKNKITDPEMMDAALKGEIAYSVSVLSKEDAEKVMASMKGRVLIKDVPNPVGFTVSLTKTPCVDNACSTKSDPNVSVKVGRSISQQNKSVLEKAIKLLNTLISTNKVEIGGDNVTKEDKKESEKKEYVEKSDVEEIVTKAVEKALKPPQSDPEADDVPKCPESDVEEIVTKAVEKALKPPQSDPEADDVPKCPECGVEVKKTDKFCHECGTDLQKNPDKMGGSTKSIPNHDKEKKKVVVKSLHEETGRDLYGRKI